ncbi:hypothetical protein GCM10027445_51120 [Amycolatopsis endophytica]|uniref:Uncharacterized protein YukE n=1 Tax=Amycolatopsis endophytica TaxID=860233 RepID=A0A853AYY8_9PSEU|nr:type VII secretion target [Amycolatopsis endophytica]NYI87814.1 uncharacterized protein YukE [Amycolatopsis endophytica]
MSGGFSVDVAALRRTAAAAAGQTSRVDALRRSLGEADVPAVSWGLLGQPVVHTVYKDLLDQLKDHLTQMTEGYQAIGAKLTTAADRYDGMDAEVVDAFEGIGEDLDEAAEGAI